MTPEEIRQLNRDVAEWLGLCWHDFEYDDEDYQFNEAHWKCSNCGIRATDPHNFPNPDFTTREGTILLLEKMRGRNEEEYTKFIMWLIRTKVLHDTQFKYFSMLSIQGCSVLLINNYILTPGALLAAVGEFGPFKEWIKGREK